MRTALALALLLAAPVAAQSSAPDSLYGAELPAVLPDSLRPAPGPEPRSRPPADGTEAATTGAAWDAALEPGGETAEEPAAAIAPGTAGNAFELAIANGSPQVGLVGVRAVVAGAPEWVEVAEASVEVGAVEPGGEGLARFAFDVRPDAPVGAEGWLVVEVVDGASARLDLRQARLVVAPPAELALDLPRPNPSRGRVVVPFALPAPAHVTLDVLDVLGRRVAVIADGEAAAGRAEAEVDTAPLAPGVYVVRLVADVGGTRAQRVRTLTVLR